MSKLLKNFYKKTIDERKEALSEINLYDASLDYKADDIVFDHLIENFITTYEVGLGVAPDFLIDGQLYHVPMATEEPSVIAGAAHAAKIIYRNGGFIIDSIKRTMLGQIIFKNVENPDRLMSYLNDHKDTFKDIAYKAHKQIHDLGGGFIDFKVENKGKGFVCLYLKVNTLDAMGANTINTILEAISEFVTLDYKAEVLMSILSNLAVDAVVKASVKINPSHLKNSDVVHHDIAAASTYAHIDPYRATTHNKGVMNGISALMLATGNDTRSIEAGAHAYAAISGKYQPLTKWYVQDNFLIGEIEIPLALGTVGGSMGILPKVKLSHKILGIQKATDLMKVAACLGLAQNFAALYALTTDGINKGHMRLHARNVAFEAGASQSNIQEVVHHLVSTKNITVDNAKDYLKSIKK